MKLKSWKSIIDLPDYIPVRVPNGISGSWEVYSFEVSEDDAIFSLTLLLAGIILL